MIAVIHRGEKFKEMLEQFQQNERSISYRKTGDLIQKHYILS